MDNLYFRMSNRNSSLGVNLGGLTYYSSEIKFVDVAKESSNWVTQRWGNHSWDTHEHATINMRSDGYPASLPGDVKLLFSVVKIKFRKFEIHCFSCNVFMLSYAKNMNNFVKEDGEQGEKSSYVWVDRKDKNNHSQKESEFVN